MRTLFLLCRIAGVIVCVLSEAAGAGAQPSRPGSAVTDFGRIGIEDDWDHTFDFQNDSPEVLDIANVALTPPLIVTAMTARVEPHESGRVTVRLGRPRKKGEFRGSVTVNFKNQAAKPLVFRVVGELVPPIDFDPFPVFFVSTQRGQPKTASIEIISHEAQPFEIISVEHSGSRFTTEIEALEPGRRYRLSLKMTGEGPAGRMTDTITLVTTSRKHHTLQVRANTNLNERVHAFPDAIDFETISTQYLKARPQLAVDLTQRLMVYQEGGKDFQISVQTDVPFLELSTSQAQLKDRYEVRASIVPEKLRAGSVNGSVVIATNDPEFPRVVIPIKAVIEGSW